MYCMSLTDIREEQLAGGKAAGLGALISHGVNVPNGFALVNAAFKMFRHVQKFPQQFEEEIRAQLAHLKDGLIIVRSSAIGEDSDEHSFAGQLDSYVVSKEYNAIEEAIKKCWAGLANERLDVYEDMSKKELKEMGVVIQEFIEPDYAGVLFTSSPIRETGVYVEYVEGRGDQLVSGQITPSQFSYMNGSLDSKDLPFDAHNLVKKSLALKEKLDKELDIEWCIKNKRLYFVQARAITTRKQEKVHWSSTNLNENYPDPISPLLYSIARDSYYHYFKNLAGLLQVDKKVISDLEYDLSNAVGIWGNRIYYNMTSIHNILSASPLKAHFKDAFNKFVGYANKDVSNAKSKKGLSLFKLAWRLMVLNQKLEKHVRIIEEKVSDFALKVDKINEHNSQALFYEFLEIRFHQWYHASLADFFSMIHYKWLGLLTQRTYGKEAEGVRNTLIQAIPGLVSSEPVAHLWDLVEKVRRSEDGEKLFSQHSASDIYKTIYNDDKWQVLRKDIDTYLKKWGFRCSGELMFFKQNFIEKPETFIDLMKSYLHNTQADPRKVIENKSIERRQAMGRFRKKIAKKRHLLFPLTLLEIGELQLVSRLCKQAISSRERVRYKQAHAYYLFKKVVHAIGQSAVEKGIVDFADDVLFMTYKEIGEMISGSSMFERDLKTQIQSKKAEFETVSKSIYPQNFSTVKGERPRDIPDVADYDTGGLKFTGLAASGGRIVANIKVLESVMEGQKLDKGDVLVTRQTDPGWAVVFPIIGGLIVERGGALSHGAIVAREFGIPAVIGVDNITSILKDNMRVILDGDLGLIQIIEGDD